MREELSGEGFKLGGTPVLLLGAIATLDVPLLSGRVPAGFRGVVGRNFRIPSGKKMVLKDKVTNALFESPFGTEVVYLVPERSNVMEGALNEPVESLMPLIRQGAEAWLLIS